MTVLDPNLMLYPAWLDRMHYPFFSHFHQLPAGKMHFIDEGTGSPVVMVHGNPGWSFEFRHLIKALSTHHRCIAPDHLGFGLSDKPRGWSYLPADHAKNFELFMDALNLNNITLVVNDWGGPIALSYVLQHPGRFKRIVLLNTWMWKLNGDPHFEKFSNMMGGSIGRFMIRHFNVFGKMVIPKAIVNKELLKDGIHAHYYKHLESADDRIGCATFPRELIHSGEWLNALWKKRYILTMIDVSIVWGMQDIAFKQKELDKWLELLVKPNVVRLDNVGHYPQEEAPDAVIQEIMRR